MQMDDLKWTIEPNGDYATSSGPDKVRVSAACANGWRCSVNGQHEGFFATLQTAKDYAEAVISFY